jgi:uncharacterized membrane protein
MLGGMTDPSVVEPLSDDGAHTRPETTRGDRTHRRLGWPVDTGRRFVTATTLAALAAAATLTPYGVVPAYAAPDGRTLTLLPVPAGAIRGYASEINNLGQIVGTVDGKAAFWSADHQITMLPTLGGATESSVLDLNDRGIAVGYLRNGQTERAVIWDTRRKTVALLAPDEPRSTKAWAINEAGEIVGTRTRPHQANGSPDGADAVRFVNLDVVPIPQGTRAVVDAIADNTPSTVVGAVWPNRRSPGCGCKSFAWQSQDIPVPRASNVLGPPDPGFSGAINGSGTLIVGQSKGLAAIWDLISETGRTPTWRRRPLIGDHRAGADTYFEGVNGSGTIAVGVALSEGVEKAVVYENGTLSELRGLNAGAYDVNNSGVIVGYAEVFDSLPALWR